MATTSRLFAMMFPLAKSGNPITRPAYLPDPA
jgi:hypothetical protein